jgi:hypothetical protein
MHNKNGMVLAENNVIVTEIYVCMSCSELILRKVETKACVINEIVFTASLQKLSICLLFCTDIVLKTENSIINA